MGEEKPGRMTARKKFEVYLEARKNPEKLGEVLRRYGLHLNHFRRIEATVETAAVEALKGRRNGSGRMGTGGGPEYEALVQELVEKDKALAELTVEYTLLKKNERLDSRGRWMGSRSTVRGGRN